MQSVRFMYIVKFSSPFLVYLFCRIRAPHTGLAFILHRFVSASWFRVCRYFLRWEKKKDLTGKALASCRCSLSWAASRTLLRNVMLLFSYKNIIHLFIALGPPLDEQTINKAQHHHNVQTNQTNSDNSVHTYIYYPIIISTKASHLNPF